MLNNIKYQFVSILNSFLSIYLIILLFLFGYSEIVSESYVVISLAIIFSQGFSANIRNIYLGSAETFNLKPLIYNRILIGFIGYIATIIITYKFIGNSNFLLHSSLTFLIFTNWILELILARYEKTEKFNTNYIVNLFLFFLISLFLIFYKNIFYLSLLIFFYSITNFLIFKNNFKKISNKSLIYIQWNFGYFTTLVRTIVNFSWKYFIILFVEKTNASFLFLGFAFGSFFSTAFDNSYGALFLKKIKNNFFFINCLFAIYLFFLLIFFFLIESLGYYTKFQYEIFFNSLIFSIFGGYFLVLGLSHRQYLFEKKNFRIICYKVDIFIYLLNFFIVLIMCLFAKQFLFLSFFICSILCFFVYKVFITNVNPKKII